MPENFGCLWVFYSSVGVACFAYVILILCDILKIHANKDIFVKYYRYIYFLKWAQKLFIIGIGNNNNSKKNRYTYLFVCILCKPIHILDCHLYVGVLICLYIVNIV
jgi:hypothetical protein